MKRYLSVGVGLVFAAAMSLTTLPASAHSNCEANQPHQEFCGCMKQHMVEGCAKQLPSAMCKVPMILAFIGNSLGNIQASCAAEDPANYDNCVRSLACFVMGSTINSDIPCSGTCVA